MKQVVIIILASSVWLAAPAMAQNTDAETKAASLRASTCQTCHGADGNSVSSTVPRLNGQGASYLYARLHSLRYPIQEAPRAIHNMGDIAPQLESKVIAALANYYAGQTPPQRHPGGGATAEGERIYKSGAGADIPACQGCHGARGEGSATAPRLAGQHGDYLELQLQAFAMAARVADPMNHHVWTMTPPQMKAVASYLSGD